MTRPDEVPWIVPAAAVFLAAVAAMGVTVGWLWSGVPHGGWQVAACLGSHATLAGTTSLAAQLVHMRRRSLRAAAMEASR